MMRALGVAYGDYRDVGLLTSDIEDHGLRHTVVANTQWSGRTRSTTEPWTTANCLAGVFGLDFRATGVRFVIEVDSDVYDLSPRNRSPLVLAARPDITRAPFDALPARQRIAVRALALAEPRRVRFEEWGALCSVLGADFDGSELRDIAQRLDFVSVDSTNDLPVAPAHESDAHWLRSAVPTAELRAFHHSVVDYLFACEDDDPLSDYLARALPAHAAAAGRFEGLLAAPRLLAKCTHASLVEALPVAFPDGIPAGAFSADLHYLDALGVAPASHAEWLSVLHLLALSQGDESRARELAESDGPLPWRTVWSN
ncbi:hypothetical protein P8605_02175 [Streptomyces sp. T-3]|nr:hypothetical protein [Streptomyces sp. T-3]